MRTRLLHAPRVARLAVAFLFSALLAFVFAGCGGGGSSSTNNGATTGINIINGSNGLGGSTINPAGDGTSGFQGKVTMTPSTPTSTTQSPISGAKIVVTLTDGTVLGSAVSDGSGNYKIPLVPGNFVVTPQNVSDTVVPVAPPQIYRVNLHAFTTVNISYYDKSKLH